MGFLSQVVLIEFCPGAHSIRDQSSEKEDNAEKRKMKTDKQIQYLPGIFRYFHKDKNAKNHLITKQKNAASVAEAPIANTTTLVPLAKMPPTACKIYQG